jgi:protein SCO1/2
VKWLSLPLLILGLLSASPAGADGLRDPFSAIGIDNRPGAAVPLRAKFHDEAGRAVTIGDYTGRRPVVLAPVYYHCPTMCGTTLRQLLASLDRVPLSPGSDYELVAVSIDPREGPGDAAALKAEVLSDTGTAARAGIHFLTGAEPDIAALTQAIGFHYKWDPELQQYAHAAAVAVLTSDGKVARWLYGLSYTPTDLRLAVAEAGQGRSSSFANQILLLCYHYNPITGRYDGLIWTMLRWACIATALGLLSLASWLFWRERRARHRARHSGAPS